MSEFFNIDNPIMSGILKVMNCILLCIVWLICCIPIFTVGAASTSLYYTVQKVLKNDRGYLLSEFFHSFRKNFKQSTLAWLIFLVVGVIFAGDIRICKMIIESGNVWGNVYVVFYFFLAIEFLYAVYVLAYIARFENSLKIIFKNSLILMFRHIGTTLLIAAIAVFCGVCMYILPPVTFIVPVVMVWFISFTLEKVFIRYMTEEEKMDAML
ncbi:MAG: YesL family protein [Hespellia sp.]|nr:YesL family protein [Hespellia sp.]